MDKDDFSTPATLQIAGDVFAVSVAGRDLALCHHGENHQMLIAALQVQSV